MCFRQRGSHARLSDAEAHGVGSVPRSCNRRRALPHLAEMALQGVEGGYNVQGLVTHRLLGGRRPRVCRDSLGRMVTSECTEGLYSEPVTYRSPESLHDVCTETS